MKEIILTPRKDFQLHMNFKESLVYQQLLNLAAEITCETAYPASILDGIQTGRIFVDDVMIPHAAIFWHYCGIAYVTGETDNLEFITSLYSLLDRTYEEPDQKSFYLIVSKNASNWIGVLDSFHEKNPLILKKERYSFSFNKLKFQKNAFLLPEGFTYFEIQPNHLCEITGRVIPSYSWDNYKDFFTFGKGFGIYDIANNRIASTAFSSGIGNGKIDIGIETQPEYRKRGFATLTAAKMVDYTLKQNMLPDWGCDSNNLGSAATAIKIGFEKSMIYSVYTKL